MQFETDVSAALKDCPQGTVFLVAVSGGADSMALLVSLCAVIPKEKFICIHIEHGLRPAEESMGDAEFVREFCTANGVECRVRHIKPGKIAGTAKRKGIGIEAAARYFRHRALSKEAKRIEGLNADGDASSGVNPFILLAHTKDDLLETVLMRVLRGVGPAGLAAMRSVSGRIMRPLLSMNRSDVIDYLKAKNISWREDSTNNDTQFLRNKIRHRLAPLLSESFSSWKKGVAALAQTQSLAAEFIGKEAEQRIKWEFFVKTSRQDAKTQSSQRKKEIEYVSTDEVVFFKQPQIIREEAIFNAINILFSSFASLRGNPTAKSVRRAVVRRFCEGKVNAADLGSVRVKRGNGKITLSKADKKHFERGFSRLIQSGI